MQKIQILLVEDHALLRATIQDTLEYYTDYEVTAVGDFGGLAESLKEEIPHLAILDFNFPDGDGFEAQKLLRGSGVLVLGMSLDERPTDPASGDLFGDEFILKGFSVEELLDAVQRLLEKEVSGGE